MPARSKLAPPSWRNRVIALRMVAAHELADHPHQWRSHPDFQQSAVRGLLQEVGIAGALLAYVSPATGALTAIDGHLRKSLGPGPWPTLILDVTDAEAALLLASHDPLAALAESDQVQLAALLQQVQSGDAAVQQLLSQLAEQAGMPPGSGQGTPADVADPDIPPDRLADVLSRWHVQSGDLWRLGRHRILCADCRLPETSPRLLDGESPQMIFADPPYGVSIVATNIPVGGGQRQKDLTGHYPIETWGHGTRGTDGAAKPFGSKAVRGSVGAAHVVAVGKYAPVIGDESTDTAIVVSSALLASYPTAVHVWWGGNYYAHTLPPSSCWLVWDKDTTGNFADCELAWTNQEKAARLFHHRWNGMLRDSEHERRWHPTQKPAALAAWVYETLGAEGDVVLDPFLGSGPSLLAGEQRGRSVYGCELSPEYMAIILERWSLLTGLQPERLV